VRGRLRTGRDLSAAEWALGLVHFARSEWGAAIPRFERALTLNPGELAPYLELVECHLALGDRRLDWLDGVRARVGPNRAESTARAAALDATGAPRALASDERALQPPARDCAWPQWLTPGSARSGLGPLLDRAARLTQAPERWRADPTAAARTMAGSELARARLDLQSTRLDRALDTLARARARAGEAADRAALAQALILEGLARAEGSDPEAARRPALEGLRLARRIGDERAGGRARRPRRGRAQHVPDWSASERLKSALARRGTGMRADGRPRAPRTRPLARSEYPGAALFQRGLERSRGRAPPCAAGGAEGRPGSPPALRAPRGPRPGIDALALADRLGFRQARARAISRPAAPPPQLGLYDRPAHLQRAAELPVATGVRREGRLLHSAGWRPHSARRRWLG
jgi:tetratricopeptide (TPR) repeat protein